MKTKIKNGIIHTQRQSLNSRIRVLWVFASLVMIIAGALGLIYIQKPISEPQLLEKQASVDNGLVNIYSEREGSFKVAEESAIYLTTNTHGVQTSGLELTFTVVTDVIDQLRMELLPVGLEEVRMEIDATSTGFLVNVATQAPADIPFSSDKATRIIKISFTPNKTGDITLNFDADKSFAPVANSDPIKDELRHVASMNFQVHESSNTAIIKQCNELCDSNAQCPVSHSCFSTNDGKRCRRADNTSSVSCAYPDEDQRVVINQKLCDQECRSETDCASNLTCYYGKCRRESNPSSTSCSSAKKRIVYKTIYRTTASTSDKEKQKGGITDQQASDSGTPAKIEEIEDKEVEIPYQEDLATNSGDQAPELPREEKTALDALLNNLDDRGFSLSLLMILAGGALIIIVIISSLLGRRSGSSLKFEKVNKQPLTPQAQEQMSSLEDRIKTLQQSAPPSARPANSPTPATPTSMAQKAKARGLVKPQGGRTEIFSKKP